MNTAWAIGELETFIVRCQEHTSAWNANRPGAYRDPAVKAIHDDVIGRMPIIEQIAQETWADWRNHLPPLIGGMSWEYDPLLQIARQLMVMLRRKDELEQNLGASESTGLLPQAALHPLIELQASPQFQIGKPDQAVFGSMKAVEVRVRRRPDEQGVRAERPADRPFSGQRRAGGDSRIVRRDLRRPTEPGWPSRGRLRRYFRGRRGGWDSESSHAHSRPRGRSAWSKTPRLTVQRVTRTECDGLTAATQRGVARAAD
jgi:hypothetical protein